MESHKRNGTITARASPHNDAQAHRPKPATSQQGLPRKVRARPKTLVPKLRFATWNIGSLTGRYRELADVLERRRVHIAFLQETRWKGNKSRNIGQGYKLMYTGSPSGKNGVAVVLSESVQNGILNVQRVNDRLMQVKVLLNGTITNLISAYAPQSGCADSEKEAFWEELEDLMHGIPINESIVVGGDLNGHVGTVRPEYERVHGGFGYGQSNAEGETILRSCVAFDLAVVNTFFHKKPEHLITYKSGPHASQIDYMLTRKCNIGKVTNCKVIPGESLTTQHRILVMDLKTAPKKKVTERKTPKTKWWLLNGNKVEEFRSGVENLEFDADNNSADLAWRKAQSVITGAGNRVLGITKGRRVFDKETWWWNDSVQTVIREKKVKFKKYQESKSPEDLAEYRTAKLAAKKAVAIARHDFLSPLYDKLNTIEGQKIVYRLAKTREKSTRDITKCLCVKDNNGSLLYNEAKVKERWRVYFLKLLNTQYLDAQPPELPANQGLVAPITPEEVLTSLRCMKNRKAVGPDNVPIEAWKSLGFRGVYLLTNLFNRILDTRKMPDPWRLSIITPVYKGKGDVQDCTNYRGIKVMCHTMKLFERIIESRLRQECTISECQYGFQPGYGTVDPIFALRTLMETHRERNQPLHLAFLDLQKAFDCVPRRVIWWALRSKGVPEVYIDIIRDMYLNSESIVRTAVGDTTSFPVTVGVHQGSALSPFLFNVLLDTVTESIQESPPWLLMYADDIALVNRDRQSLEHKVNTWKKTLENGGLQLNVAKTEYLACCSTDPGSISIGEETARRAESFRYLGSVLHEAGGIDHDVKARINAAWAKWRDLTGVLCDRRMPLKLKGLIYKSIIRPVLLYGSETWPALARHVQELRVTEMKMLRWMCNVTRRDRQRNDHIRGRLSVRDIGDKLQEARLRWYGHVARKPQSYVGNRCLNIAVPGAKSRGRPRKRWLDVVSADLRANRLQKSDAQDRAKWARKCRKADPT